LLLVPPAPAQQQLSQAFLEGTHVFRRILKDMHFSPVTSWGDLSSQPRTKENLKQTIIIFHGDPGNELRLKHLLGIGGAVLLASDQKIGSEKMRNDLLAIAGVTITGELVHCPAEVPPHPSRYRDNEDCPLLCPLQAGEELFRGNLRVATNRPSWLQVQQGGLPWGIERLAELPDGCERYRLRPSAFIGTGFHSRRLGKDQRLFAVGVEVGESRLLVLADHSLFINAMMMQPDNGNVEFAYNCLDYLRGPAGSKQRNQVLFVEEGKVNSNFNVPLKDVPGIPPGAINAVLAKVGDHLAELEKPRAELGGQNVFDHSIVSWWDRHGVTSGHVRNAVLVLLTVVLLAYGCLRLLRANGYRPEPGVPLVAEASAAALPTADLPDQRLQALMQLGNFWESGRALARQVFASASEPPGLSRRTALPSRPDGSGEPSYKAAAAGSSVPRIVVRGGGWWQRWRRRRQVARLWRLAHAATPVRISPAAWPRLVAELEQLQADLAQGMVQVGKVV